MIYAIGTTQHGFIKFGLSANPGPRLLELQVGCPLELVLLASAPWPSVLETRVHEFLERFSVRGEWFKDSEQCRFVVACIRDNDQERFSEAFYSQSVLRAPHLFHPNTVRALRARGAYGTGVQDDQASRARTVETSTVENGQGGECAPASSGQACGSGANGLDAAQQMGRNAE